MNGSIMQFKMLEKQEWAKLEPSSQQDVIKIREEISDKEIGKSINLRPEIFFKKRPIRLTGPGPTNKKKEKREDPN